ncbi:hypothetical protein EDC02_7660 [Micromonospora sp. Llam0]|uniref:hypothetical protein n=1 Tax=Micromonospora sp. Llam0 TaxID=2485143 RepID=UPI000F460845|nr:hypothetical protein [Micromonospora sp. Llam0]ROO52719.1 hypothetical protein EDC02_7660 [Micromonospora sp. Llam0]
MLGWGRRLIAAGIAAAAVVFGSAAAAQASWGDPVNCVTDPTNPACVITITDPGGSSSGGGSGTSGCHDSSGRLVPCFVEGKGWWGGDGCYYQHATGDDLAFAEALGGPVPPPAYWYLGTCGDPIDDWWPSGYTRFSVFGPNIGIELLAAEAVKRLTLPAPQIGVNPDAGAQMVFVPTWLWVEPATFTSRSATASLGGLSVTAVATPARVTWTTGDGTSVMCGRGTPWTPGGDPAAESPDCGHTYTTTSHSQAGGIFTVRATVTWDISWSGGGQTGTEPALTSTSIVQVRVAESSVVNTQ